MTLLEMDQMLAEKVKKAVNGWFVLQLAFPDTKYQLQYKESTKEDHGQISFEARDVEPEAGWKIADKTLIGSGTSIDQLKTWTQDKINNLPVLRQGLKIEV